MSMLAHLGGVVLACVGWLPALVIYLLRKDQSAFVRTQAGEAVGFQLLVLIGYVLTTAGYIGLGIFAHEISWIGSVLIALVWLTAIVFGVLAAISVNRGRNYRYPLALRVLR